METEKWPKAADSPLRQAIERKRSEFINRKGVVVHHDNARAHTSLMTRETLREFDREVLMHPPYSPDVTPSDHDLFRSLQNSLHGTKLASREACENHLIQFFNQKPHKFHTNRIMTLPKKLQNIVDNNGEYLVYINWSPHCNLIEEYQVNGSNNCFFFVNMFLL